MMNRAYANDGGGLSAIREASDVVRFVEIDADNTLDDSVPWEYLDCEDDPE